MENFASMYPYILAKDGTFWAAIKWLEAHKYVWKYTANLYSYFYISYPKEFGFHLNENILDWLIGTQFIHKRAGALIPAMVHGLTLLLLLLQVASVVSDSVRPQRRKPTRLPHLWDSPGKNTGVGCHFLLQCMKVKSESEVAQSCLILSDPMDCSLPGSSVHGIFQARVLEWGAIAFSGLTLGRFK